MPTRIQPSMDLQLTASGMGPAMMRLDLGVMTPEQAAPLLTELAAEIFAPIPVPEPIPAPTRWQRVWAVLNMDVRDIWRAVWNYWRN